MKCKVKNKNFYVSIFIISFIFIFSDRRLFSSSIQEFEDDLNNPEVVKILSIDGGGIRGIVPIKMIKKIEQEVGKPIAQIFDLIAGTSTGGLIALASTLPAKNSTPEKFIPVRTPDELLKFYTEDSDKIFGAKYKRKLSFNGLVKPKYSSKGISMVTQEIFGDAKLSDIPSHVMVPAFSTNHFDPIFFDSEKAKLDKKDDFFIKDLGVGIGAAPTFFSATEIRNMENSPYSIIDGGIIANNPTLLACCAIKEKYPGIGMRNFLVVSLGTGADIKSIRHKDIKNLGGIKLVSPLISMMLGGGAGLIDLMMQLNLPNIKINGGATRQVYWRFQPAIRSEDKKMDDVSKENIDSLTTIADKSIKDNKEKIKDLCALLRMSKEEYGKDILLRRSSAERYGNFYLSGFEQEDPFSRRASIASYGVSSGRNSPRNSMTMAEGIKENFWRRMSLASASMQEEVQRQQFRRNSNSQPQRMFRKSEQMESPQDRQNPYGNPMMSRHSPRRASEVVLRNTHRDTPALNAAKNIMRYGTSVYAGQDIQSGKRIEKKQEIVEDQELIYPNEQDFDTEEEFTKALAEYFHLMSEKEKGNLVPRSKSSARRKSSTGDKYIKSEGDMEDVDELKRKRKKRSRRSETQKRERTPVIVVDALTEEMPKKRVKSKKALKEGTSDQNIKVVEAPRAKSPLSYI